MNVKLKERKKQTKFGSINRFGTPFRWASDGACNTFMTISCDMQGFNGDKMNAINLLTGDPCHINGNAIVEVLKGSFVEE